MLPERAGLEYHRNGVVAPRQPRQHAEKGLGVAARPCQKLVLADKVQRQEQDTMALIQDKIAVHDALKRSGLE